MLIIHFARRLVLISAVAGILPSCQQQTARAQAPQLAAEERVDVRIVRFASGTGELLVSSGIPLRAGMLWEDHLRNVKLVLGDNHEPTLFVAPLGGTHKDGSLRSVLIQFRHAAADSITRGQLVIGPAVRRTSDASRSPVEFTYERPLPDAVLLPSSSEYLISTELIGKASPTLPTYSLPYENNFASNSDMRWKAMSTEFAAGLDANKALTRNYYDRAYTHWVWWVRTGDVDYWKRAVHYLIAYREQYLRPAKYYAQPHNWAVEGLALHYLLTGDEESKRGVQGLGKTSNDVWLPIIGDVTAQWLDARIQERVLLALMAAHTVGLRDRNYPQLLRSSLTEILDTQLPDGSYAFRSTCAFSNNFMTALLNDAMIRYYETIEPDERIVKSVKASADWLWKTQWVVEAGGFKYFSGTCQESGPNPAPDLNMLFVNAFGWLYQRTGGAAYKLRGDIVFQEGIKRAWLGDNADQGDKQFNQQYRSSFRYLVYRNGPGD